MLKVAEGILNFFLAMFLLLATYGMVIGALLIVASPLVALFRNHHAARDGLFLGILVVGSCSITLVLIVGTVKASYALTHAALLDDANEMCNEIPDLLKTIAIGLSFLLIAFLILKALGWFLWFAL